MKSTIREKYEKLESKYWKLKKRYDFVRKITLHREHIKRRVFDNYLLVAVSILGTISLILFRSQIAIEIGIIAVTGMLIHEIVGTKKDWWKYNGQTSYKLCGRVPVHLIFTYFFSTVVLLTYVMFRLGVL